MPLDIHPETHAVARGLPAIRALLLLRLFHFLHRRRAHPAIEVAPIIATRGPPGTSSSARKLRPSMGSTPRMRRKLAETRACFNTSGPAPPDSETFSIPFRKAPISL